MFKRIGFTKQVWDIIKTSLILSLTIAIIASIAGCGDPRSIGVTKNNGQLSKRALQGTPIAPNANFDAAKLANADFARGGQLYDNWSTVLQKSTPTSTNPIWSLTGNATVNTADSWRCSSCHGWDYQGANGAFGNPTNPFFTGIHGILPAAHQFTDATVWSFLRDGVVTDSTSGLTAKHDFITQLSDTDLYDLTKFVITARQEATAKVSPLNTNLNVTRVNGNKAAGANLYNANLGANCAGCHGKNGTAVPGVNIITAASSDPARVVHRVRFGIASATEPMPGLITAAAANDALTSLRLAGDVTTFAGHGGNSDHLHGGRMYDDWAVESNVAPTGVPNNPLWDLANITTAVKPTGIESWHCADCHGWDFEGGIAFQKNNLVELKQVRGWGPGQIGNFQYVYDRIVNGFPMMNKTGQVVIVHNYGQFFAAGMTDQDVWDLADFVIEETVDTHEFLNPDTGTAAGGLGRLADAVIGGVFYNGTGSMFGALPYSCAACHGADGKGVVGGIALDLPALSWSDPWRFFHRTRFGTPRAPGSTLTALDPAATFMVGILEATKASGVAATDNDDAMHAQRFVQVNLNGGAIAAASVQQGTAAQRAANLKNPR